jgi:hypothetical protein
MNLEDIKSGKIYKHSYRSYLYLYDRKEYLKPPANVIEKIYPEIPFFVVSYKSSMLSILFKILTEQGKLGFLSLDNYFVKDNIFPYHSL